MSEKHPIIPGLSYTHPDDCECLVCSETRAECDEKEPVEGEEEWPWNEGGPPRLSRSGPRKK